MFRMKMLWSEFLQAIPKPDVRITIIIPRNVGVLVTETHLSNYTVAKSQFLLSGVI